MLKKQLTKKTSRWQRFDPDYIAKSVLDVDFEYLAKQGIKAGLIDLDGTVVQRGKFIVSLQLSKQLHKQPLDLYIATNRPKSRDLKDLREQLNAKGVIHPIGLYGKPFARYYSQAASEHGLLPNQVVMIGDRYIQDIYGANSAGLKTVLICKIDKPKGIADKLLSQIERRRTDKLFRLYQPLD